MSTKKKYNYNYHLCKQITKLEDFTVEFKNDPFKAIKLFIDSYMWLRDPSKNKFPEELAGQTVAAIEKYVRKVIEDTASRWASIGRKFVRNPPDIGYFRGFSYDSDGVYLKNVSDDYIGIGLRAHPVSFVTCTRVYFEIYLPYLINTFIGPPFIHTNILRVFDSSEYTVSVSECLDFTPKQCITLSERDALEIYCARNGDDKSKNYDNLSILHEWEKKTFCKENYKAHGLFVPMKADMPIIRKAVYQENRGCSITDGIKISTAMPSNNTNNFMEDYT
jgi:hypothetical protein